MLQLLPSRRRVAAHTVLGLIALFITELGASNTTAPPSPANAEVYLAFTGRLFGYYRIRYHTKHPPLPPVKAFLEDSGEIPPSGKIRAGELRNPILLAMGDNFSPEFGARLQEEGESSDTSCYLPLPKPSKDRPYVRYPDDFFKSDQRLVRYAYCDAVANFLEQAGYRAVVPGREDFLYGAGWLRNIASLLKDDQKTTMLASNLRIVSGATTKKTNNALPQCGLLFDKYSGSQSSQLCSKSPDGQLLVPEKVRLLRELDLLLAKPPVIGRQGPSEAQGNINVRYSAYRTKYEDVTKITKNTKDVVRNSSELTAAVKQRQLLLKDLIEIFSLSLPDCSPHSPTAKELPGPKLDKAVQQLLRSVNEDQVTATNLGLSEVKDGLDGVLQAVGNGRSETDKASLFCESGGTPNNQIGRAKQFPQALEDFGHFLDSKLENEHHIEDQIAKGEVPIEPGILVVGEPGGRYDDTILEKGRHALLVAIANEQQDVGFTEVVVPDQRSHGHPSTTVLVLGVVGVETMQAIQDTNRSLALCPPTNGEGAYGVCQAGSSKPTPGVVKLTVNWTEPVQTVEAVLRAAEARHGKKYDFTVLMAQMPHTEAEELGAHIRADALSLSEGEKDAITPQPDLVISEAQQEHATLTTAITYRSSDSYLAPVLTPYPAYDVRTEGLITPKSTALLTGSGAGPRSIAVYSHPVPIQPSGGVPKSAMSLLISELPHHDRYQLAGLADASMDQVCTAANLSNATTTAEAEQECDLATMHAILGLLRSSGRGTDVAMLERRDMFLEGLPSSYDGYEMCDPCNKTHLDPVDGGNDVNLSQIQPECRLRVALARVLWQSDDAAKLMISGKDLATALSKAQDLSDNRSSLAAGDITQQWLETNGIVDPVGSTTLSSAMFSVQDDIDCHDPAEQTKPSAGGKEVYCVNGVPLQADHAYWVITSSRIATQKTEYALAGANPADYTEKATRKSLVDLAVEASQKQRTVTDIPKAESAQQQAKLFHVDIGKLVAGYSLQHPIGGSSNIINRFQGVSDATASSAGSANLDLEQKQRIVWEFKRGGFGVQNDAEYDRQVQDNLTGKFVNGNFTKNQFSAGPFLQSGIPIRVHPQREGERWFSRQSESKALPRWLLVFAPAQFQTQLTGSHLNFPVNSGTSQISYVTPRAHGVGERIGMRHEFDGGAAFYPDKGSYFESGGQFVQQRQVLAGLTFSTPGLPSVSCPANGSESVLNCAPKTLTTSSAIKGQYASTNDYGWYWDIHLQKGYGKTYDKSTSRMTLTLDSKGDFFKDRGVNHAFSTQTWYDAPASVAFTFPVFRNLSFGPTYTGYFYSDQISENYLLVHTFSVNLRWYVDRDSNVPVFWRTFLFKGPASADETQASKTK